LLPKCVTMAGCTEPGRGVGGVGGVGGVPCHTRDLDTRGGAGVTAARFGAGVSDEGGDGAEASRGWVVVSVAASRATSTGKMLPFTYWVRDAEMPVTGN
jgi:hypothetical protein